MKKDWKTIVIALAILIGLVGAISILINHNFLATTQQVPWGLLIGIYVFFAVASTGVGLLGSLATIFNVKRYEAIAKRTPFISLILLLTAFISLAIELGSPLNLIYILISPNLSAPIWWMGFFYTIYLIGLAVQVFYLYKHGHAEKPILEKLALFVKLAAVSNLGAVFAINASRPFWQGAFLPVLMVIAAIVSGAAILTIYSYLDESIADEGLYVDFGKILFGSVLIHGLASLWLFVVTSSSSAITDYFSASVLLGPRFISFWFVELLIGAVVPILVMLISQFNRKYIFASAILALIGLVANKLNFLSAGQMTPLYPRDQFFWAHPYFPSLAEWSILIGAIGLSIYLIQLLNRKIKILEPEN